MRLTSRMLIGILFAGALAAQAASPAPNAPNPEMAAKAAAGELGHANAAWWGFDAEDATASLQAAIDSGVKNLTIPFMGSPWIVLPLRLRSHLQIHFEPGVVILAKKGAFKGKGDSLFRARDAQDIQLKGYGATLRMHHADYMTDAYEAAEWRMTLSLCGCSDILVEGLRLESSGGDGVYLGATEKQPWCENVVLKHLICDDHHRQGISVIGAVNLLIEDCVLSNTHGTAPAAGIDFEPNRDNERLVNCMVRNCIMRGNEGAGVLVYLKNLSDASEPVSLRFDHCLIDGGNEVGTVVGAVRDQGPAGGIAFENCMINGSRKAGAYLYDKSAKTLDVRFMNCQWADTWNDPKEKHLGPKAPVLIRLGREEIAQQQGGFTFIRCQIYDTEDRPALVVENDANTTAATGLSGQLHVHNPHGARLESKIPLEASDIELIAVP